MRIEQLEDTMTKQREIWTLRVHELKEALKQAKRAQDAPEDDQAKAQSAWARRFRSGSKRLHVPSIDGDGNSILCDSDQR